MSTRKLCAALAVGAFALAGVAWAQSEMTKTEFAMWGYIMAELQLAQNARIYDPATEYIKSTNAFTVARWHTTADHSTRIVDTLRH